MRNYPLLYLEHLSERDLDLLARATGRSGPVAALRAQITANPENVDDLLAEPRVFDAIFGGAVGDIGPRVSPFLTFGVLVNRSARDISAAAYLPEWAGAGKRLPVFDVASLQEFLGRGAHRFFLVELLASFTRVASGAIWVKTRRGYRRRRFSELDLVHLSERVDALPASMRPAGYRRLGDVALFHAGVFPDHTARRHLVPGERERLAHSAGMGPAMAIGGGDDLRFHELAAAAWYRRAVEAAAAVVGTGPEFLEDMADHVPEARRTLNFLTDRYLFRFDTGLGRPGW